MSTISFIHAYIGLPLLAFFASLLFKKRQESALSILSYSTAGLQLVLVLFYGYFWLRDGSNPTQFKELSVYSSDNYEFFIDFLVDTPSYLFFNKNETPKRYDKIANPIGIKSKNGY